MIDEHLLEPGGGRALRLPAGARVLVRDVEGRQACEMVALVAEDPTEHLDCSVTMEVVGRLFPTEKSKFYSNRYEPLLTLLEDRVGWHDLVHPASSRDSRRLFLGEEGGRAGTREVLERVLREAGLEGVLVPRPVHLFRRTDVDEDGNFVMMETPSGPGDGVTLQVERELVLAFAVPDDEISPVCGCDPTPIRVEVHGVV